MPQITRSLYEQPRFRIASGAELRPGGLDLTAELAFACALEAGQRVLDVGCGVGATASFLTRTCGVTAVGLDGSAASIAEAGARDQQVTWVLGRAEDIGYPDGYFDACFCECLLSALDDPALVLREVRRILRPNGVLGVTDLYLRAPEEGAPLGAIATANCLRGASGQEVTIALFESAGFEICVWQDRSETLKRLMASLIFAYGSAARLLGGCAGRRRRAPQRPSRPLGRDTT